MTAQKTEIERDQLHTDDTTTTIQLMEEKLDVSTTIHEYKVTVTKVPETRTETRDVQIMHGEISIERRQPADTTTTQEPVSSKQQIEIQLRREEAVVTKTPYLKEEW